jgi:chromosome segregation ATPase
MLPSREAELEAMLADAQEQLLARDDAIRSLRSDEFAEREDFIARQGEAIQWLEGLVEHRDGEIEWLRGIVAQKETELASLREELNKEMTERREAEKALGALQASRLWRLGGRYWQVRDRLLRRTGRAR